MAVEALTDDEVRFLLEVMDVARDGDRDRLAAWRSYCARRERKRPQASINSS